MIRSIWIWALGFGVWDLIESQFKGWAKPGPVPPGASSPPRVPEDETLDAISGHFRIFQLRGGHRFSTDDVLTAWYGTTWAPSAAAVLDLGSGIGSVGMIAAWRLPGSRVVTIEAQPGSVRLARKSADYNGLSGRYEIREGDFRDAGAISETERFDLDALEIQFEQTDGDFDSFAGKWVLSERDGAVVGDVQTACSRRLSLGAAAPPVRCDR